MRNSQCQVVLVNWKRAQDTVACLESLEQSVGVNWTAVVCENGSPDGSGEVLRAYLGTRYTEIERTSGADLVIDYFPRHEKEARSPRVTLVISSRNLGFAGGNNLAFSYRHDSVDPDFVWFLNNDTEVEPDALQLMINHMKQNPQIGICGCTLIYAHDRRTVQAFGGAIYQPWTGAVSEIGQGKQWPCDVDTDSVVAQMRYVSGASMLVSRGFLDLVGLMSEDYFLYYEEIDWAERARKAGYQLGYVPQAVVYHKEGAALGSGKSAGRSMLAEYYGVKNRLVVTQRFFPWALPTVYLFSVSQILKRCLQGNWAHARMMVAVLLRIRREAPTGR